MTIAATGSGDQAGQLEATHQAQEERNGLNALQANIEKKREQSYYYAHKTRDTAEESAPPPVHVVLERSVAEAVPTAVTIFNYAWSDEGEVVKLYVPLDGVGASCGEEDIKATFEVRSLRLDIHGYKSGQVHRLAIDKLSSDITPDECRVRKLAKKVVVALKKAKSGKWYNLRG